MALLYNLGRLTTVVRDDTDVLTTGQTVPAVFTCNSSVFASNTAVAGCNSAGAAGKTAAFGCNAAVWASNTAAWGCNAAAFGSNTAAFGSNAAVWGCNAAAFGSNTAAFGSNAAVWGCNAAAWGSNAGASGSNRAVWASNAAAFGSNTAVFCSNTTGAGFSGVAFGSNAAVFGCNTAVSASLCALFGCNAAVWGCNAGAFASNCAVYASNAAVNGSNTAVAGCNSAVFGCNTAVAASGRSTFGCNTGVATSNALAALSNAVLTRGAALSELSAPSAAAAARSNIGLQGISGNAFGTVVTLQVPSSGGAGGIVLGAATGGGLVVEALRVADNAKVGVKQASPTYDLDVAGSVRMSGAAPGLPLPAGFTTSTVTATFAAGNNGVIYGQATCLVGSNATTGYSVTLPIAANLGTANYLVLTTVSVGQFVSQVTNKTAAGFNIVIINPYTCVSAGTGGAVVDFMIVVTS